MMNVNTLIIYYVQLFVSYITEESYLHFQHFVFQNRYPVFVVSDLLIWFNPLWLKLLDICFQARR